jgi:asparagine N-glycosylation enzyme membrane subunit Stt3
MKEPPRHALSPGGSDKKGGVIREAQGFASAGQIGHLPTMKLPRPLLHAARIADKILFYPALALVIWGELTGTELQALGFFGELSDKALHAIAYFGLAAMAAAGFKSRWTVVLAALGLIVLGGALEIVQGFTGRDMSFYDELANTAGVVAGAILARAIIEPLRNRFEYW